MRKIILIIGITLLIFQMIVLAVDIDIGSPAISRGWNATYNYTRIVLDNPANATGTITSVEIWSNSTLSNVKVGTFWQVSSGHFSSRDYETIGTVGSGSKKTFTVNLDVENGDVIGMFYTAGQMAKTTTGFAGVRFTNGDRMPCDNVFFDIDAGCTISLYGTGTTEEEEENAIWFGTNL